MKALVIYEMPWFAPLIWFDWGQELVAYYVAWKVTRKVKRYRKLLLIKEKYERKKN